MNRSVALNVSSLPPVRVNPFSPIPIFNALTMNLPSEVDPAFKILFPNMMRGGVCLLFLNIPGADLVREFLEEIEESELDPQVSKVFQHLCRHINPPFSDGSRRDRGIVLVEMNDTCVNSLAQVIEEFKDDSNPDDDFLMDLRADLLDHSAKLVEKVFEENVKVEVRKAVWEAKQAV